MTSVVIPLRRRVPEKGPWTNQELAEFYRVTDILNRAGMAVSTESGLTDEGDPWLVFVRDDTADVVAHFARVDGEFIAVSSPTGQVVRGTDFRDLVNRLMRLQPLMLPQLQPVRANVYLHPSVVLVAFVAMALLLSTSKPAEAADGESTGGSTPPALPPAADGSASDGHGGDAPATMGTAAAGKQAMHPVALGRDSGKDAKVLLEMASLGRGAPATRAEGTRAEGTRVEATLNGQQMVSLAAVVAVALTIMEGQPDAASAASRLIVAEGDGDAGSESARGILTLGTQTRLDDDEAKADEASLADTADTAATAETDVSAPQALRAVQAGPAALALAEIVVVPPESGDAVGGGRSLVFPDIDGAVNGVLLVTATGGGTVVTPAGASLRTPADNLPPDIVVVQTTTGAEFRIVPVATTQAIAGFTDLVEIRFEIVPPPKPPATDATTDAAAGTAPPRADAPTGEAPDTATAPIADQAPPEADGQGTQVSAAPDVPSAAGPGTEAAAKGESSAEPEQPAPSAPVASAPVTSAPVTSLPAAPAPVVQTPAPAPPATPVAAAAPAAVPSAPTPATPAPAAPIDPGNIVVIGRGIGTGEVVLTAGIDTVIFTGGGQIVHGFDFATDRLVYDRASVDVTSMKANFLGSDTLVLTFGDGSFIKLVGVVNADLGFG